MILKDNCFGCITGWSPKANAVGEGLFGRTDEEGVECECEFCGERIAGGMPLTGLEPFPP